MRNIRVAIHFDLLRFLAKQFLLCFTCHVFTIQRCRRCFHQSENFSSSFTLVGAACRSANSHLSSFTFRKTKTKKKKRETLHFIAIGNNSPSYEHRIENDAKRPHVGSLSWICCVCTQNLRWYVCRTASFVLQRVFGWIVQYHSILEWFQFDLCSVEDLNRKTEIKKKVEIINSTSRANVSMGRAKVTKFASTRRSEIRQKRFKGVNKCLTQFIKSTRSSHELNSTTCMKVTLSLYRQSQTQYLGW